MEKNTNNTYWVKGWAVSLLDIYVYSQFKKAVANLSALLLTVEDLSQFKLIV